MTPKETYLAYQGACARHDWQQLRLLLHPGFEFRGPTMQVRSAEEFIAAMQQFACTFENRNHSVLEAGGSVAALLDCVFAQPCAATVRMSEWVVVRDGRMVRSDLVFNPAEMTAMPPA